MEVNKIICGHWPEAGKDIPSNSIDTEIVDPPYGLKFMGKKWDYDVPSVDDWKEALRVLKPGGTLLCFAGSRTQHRMACNIEDAGFILKDCLLWIYGSGFPKAADISKQLDKGHEREVIGDNPNNRPNCAGKQTRSMAAPITIQPLTAPCTPEAKLWNGWKSHGLKPAYEPVIWATKPLMNNNEYVILQDINIRLGDVIWQLLVKSQKEDTFKSQEMVSIGLNTALLWNVILGELLINENKFIILTESKMITELKTLSLLLSKNTQESMDGKYQTYHSGTQEYQANGLKYLAKIVEKILVEEKWNIKDIQNVIAQEIVICKQNENGTTVGSVENDLLPIILIVNTVLLNVLEDLITKNGKPELKEIAVIVEKSLKQYHQDQQNIATIDAWGNIKHNKEQLRLSASGVEKSLLHQNQGHVDIVLGDADTQNLFPNFSPIIVAMKPNEGTYAENALKHGVAGLNIDGARIEGKVGFRSTGGFNSGGNSNCFGNSEGVENTEYNQGRFPANVIFDEEAAALLDQQTGLRPAGGSVSKDVPSRTGVHAYGHYDRVEWDSYNDEGGASRFFYCAKASKAERNAGCDELKQKAMTNLNKIGGEKSNFKTGSGNERDIYNHNNHPTVKPVSLMEYLCRLTKTPTGGLVLDMYGGSGTTGIGCVLVGRDYILIDEDEGYCDIAEHRIAYFKEHGNVMPAVEQVSESGLKQEKFF